MQDARESCRLFHERLKRILRCRLIREIERTQLMVEIWERPNGRLELVLPKIEEDDLDAFLLNYRLLQQDKDRISIRNMSSTIESLTLAPQTKTDFETLRKSFNAYLDEPPEMQVLGEPKDKRALIDTLLYGVYAHLDKSKGTDAAYWARVLKQDHVQLLFASTIKGIVDHLRKFEALMREVDTQLKII